MFEIFFGDFLMWVWGLLWLCVYALFYVILESLDALELLVKWWQLRGSCSGGIVGCGSRGLWVLWCGLLMVVQW